MKVSIVYWSGTGNTEKMAELVADGAKGAGAEVSLFPVSKAVEKEVLEANIIALGCPATGTEELESDEFLPFLEKIEPSLSGKKVALFGSHDWGEGQWMEDWAKRMKDSGAVLVAEPVIANLEPDADAEKRCQELGASFK